MYQKNRWKKWYKKIVINKKGLFYIALTDNNMKVVDDVKSNNNGKGQPSTIESSFHNLTDDVRKEADDVEEVASHPFQSATEGRLVVFGP